MTSNYKRNLRRQLAGGLPDAMTVRIDVESGRYGKRVVARIKRTDDQTVYIARPYPTTGGVWGVSATTLCHRIIEDYEGMNVA